MADGVIGYVPLKDVEDYSTWKKSNSGPTENRILQSAHQFMGIPYLWGGTSIKGMDCSGFTKLVFQSNGWIIPRDASQQAREGILVDSLRNWENLKPGDLLFFGEKRPDGTNKVVHVGLWEGRNAYIHAADRTRRASVDPQSKDFDAYNLNRYLFTKRINAISKEVQKSTKLFGKNMLAQSRQTTRRESIKFGPCLGSNYSQMRFGFLLRTRRKTKRKEHNHKITRH